VSTEVVVLTDVEKARRAAGPAPDPAGDAIVSLATALEDVLRGGA